MERNRFCLSCRSPIPPHYRKDRKYCPVKFGRKNYCKNARHNRETLREYHQNKGINKIHRENWRILNTIMMGRESCLINEAELLYLGFHLEYAVVQAELTNTKNKAFLYREFALELIADKRYKIIRHGKQFTNSKNRC